MTTPMICTTPAEFRAAFNLLSKLERRQAAREARVQARIADLLASHKAFSDTLQPECEALRAAIAAYAEANRAELTDGGKSKTMKLSGGCIKWRKQPAKVEVSGELPTILTALKRRRLTRFIRVKEELDKTALLKEAGAIKTPIDGLRIVDGVEKLAFEFGGQA